jgi:hypothetical protein
VEGGHGKEEVGVALRWPWLRPLSRTVETGVVESEVCMCVCVCVCDHIRSCKTLILSRFLVG